MFDVYSRSHRRHGSEKLPVALRRSSGLWGNGEMKVHPAVVGNGARRKRALTPLQLTHRTVGWAAFSFPSPRPSPRGSPRERENRPPSFGHSRERNWPSQCALNIGSDILPLVENWRPGAMESWSV